MKEFVSNVGGRYTYADDILNLQDLALAFSHIFDGCGNFVVSGCNVDDSSISAGVVYLNGKLRKFNGASGITQWPQYLCEHNTTEQLDYKDGGQKVGRNSWGCLLRASLPTDEDPMTGVVRQHIVFANNGAVRMKDAWLGRYSLLLDAAGKSQTVSSELEVAGGVKTKKVDLSQDGVKSSAMISNNTLLFQVTPANSTDLYEMYFGKLYNGVALYKNGTKLAGFSATQATIKGDLSVKKINVGDLSFSDDGICRGRPVNIAPVIAEGGVLLSEKYATKGELAEKAGTVDVYSRSESDDMFLKRAELLKDAVKTPDDQTSVCRTINAQQTLKDTGWLDVGVAGIRVRQYGKLVMCQGALDNMGSGMNVCTLPDEIDTPSHAASTQILDPKGGYIMLYAAAGSRVLTVNKHPDGNWHLPFTLTYFTN